jgi:hypothetical protein
MGQPDSPHSKITVLSYLLRDRAVIIDSLVLRKCVYVAFKTGQSISAVKGAAVTGTLSNNGVVLARDTAWLFDEAAGNLGFNLPYEIPGGTYRLEIQIINPAGKILDSLIQEYDRADLKPYFNREINFWDFTSPYAHLECSGYGIITYNFTSPSSISGVREFMISARVNSDNDLPGIAEVIVNGTNLGKFKVPAGNPETAVVHWNAKNEDTLRKITIHKGLNQLSFLIKPETGYEGTGLRIYAHKNSADKSIPDEIPISFDIKYGSPLKKNSFSIPVWGLEGEHITSRFNLPVLDKFSLSEGPQDVSDLALTRDEIKQGYVVFTRDFQRNVYPWTVPARIETTDSLRVKMSRNDFEPLTFSVYPLRDLGEVKVSISNLSSSSGRILSSGNILIQVARIMKIRTGEGSNYRLVPRFLDRTDHSNIPIAYTTRFWLTIHADSLILPGTYNGMIRISSENGREKLLPLTVEILPVTLRPVPGIDYSMCMSYEFFELESKEWSPAQKEKIYKDGVNSFKDYINHGMTTVVVSSPYYFQWNSDGTPKLEHLKAMLKASGDVGFTRPVFWYFGHYVQAAKGQHPGNIRLYDSVIHPARARSLVETAMKYSAMTGGPPLEFMPIDEPRIALRQKITIELFKAIKKVPGARIMCTTDIGGNLLDIENNSQADRKPLSPGVKERKSDRKVWEYDNSAVDCMNPCYTRYIYGYYTWRQDLDGMNSWGPGTTENSRGNPYEDLDHEYSDYAITFPHSGGPLSTPNWEALREGIDDIRYVYQLERLCINKAGDNPGLVAEAEKFLDEIRGMCDFDDRSIINDYGKWTPEQFNSLRSRVISWILKLSNK